MTRIGVVTFPGTLDDRDAARAVRLAGAEADRTGGVAVVERAGEGDDADPRHACVSS